MLLSPCCSVAMETTLAKQHQMSNAPICFFHGIKEKKFNCLELRKGEDKVLAAFSISVFFPLKLCMMKDHLSGLTLLLSFPVFWSFLTTIFFTHWVF